MDSPVNLRLLGVDYGRRRTGLALSDPEGILAYPLGVLGFRGLDDLAARIAECAVENEVSGVVLGFPRHMDDSPGELAPEVESLAEKLRSRHLIVVLWDERLTSWEASQRLREASSARRKRNRETVDDVAAAVLLQSYLESLRNR